MEQPLIWFTRAEALGDRKPSHMMNRMLALIPEGFEPGFLFKYLFMNRLPEGIRNQLVLIKTEQLRELAVFADQLWLANAASVAATPLTCSPLSPCIVCIRRRVTSPIDLCDWPPFFDWNRNLRSLRFSTGAAPMKPPAVAASAAAPVATCPCSVCTGRHEASPTGLRDWPPHFEWNHSPRSFLSLTGAAPMEPPAAASAASAAAVAAAAVSVAATVAASTAATAAATTASTVAAALAASSAAIVAASTASSAAASAAASSAAAVAASAYRRRLSRRPQPLEATRYRRPPPTLTPPPAPVRRFPPRAT